MKEALNSLKHLMSRPRGEQEPKTTRLIFDRSSLKLLSTEAGNKDHQPDDDLNTKFFPRSELPQATKRMFLEEETEIEIELWSRQINAMIKSCCHIARDEGDPLTYRLITVGGVKTVHIKMMQNNLHFTSIKLASDWVLDLGRRLTTSLRSTSFHSSKSEHA